MCRIHLVTSIGTCFFNVDCTALVRVSVCAWDKQRSTVINLCWKSKSNRHSDFVFQACYFVEPPCCTWSDFSCFRELWWVQMAFLLPFIRFHCIQPYILLSKSGIRTTGWFWFSGWLLNLKNNVSCFLIDWLYKVHSFGFFPVHSIEQIKMVLMTVSNWCFVWSMKELCSINFSADFVLILYSSFWWFLILN